MRKFDDSDYPNYTLIATFETIASAERSVLALQKLLKDMKKHPEFYDTDWKPDQALISRDGKIVTFTVQINLSLELAQALSIPRALLVGIGAIKFKEYEDYQKLVVTATVPTGITPKAAALILGKDDNAMIAWFMKHAGNPTVKKGGNTQILSWVYHGERIYDSCNGLHTLVLNDDDFALEHHKHWYVQVLVSS
jgi:hypothetical protein